MLKLLKLFAFTVIIFASCLTQEQIHAQNTNDSIRIKHSFWGNNFYIGDKEYSESDIKDILYNDLNSQKLMDASGSSKTWGYITLSAGVLLTGYALYEAWGTYNNYGVSPFKNHYSYSGGSYDASTFIITTVLAVGLDLAGILQLLGSRSKFYKAIKTYNKGMLTSSFEYKFYIDNNSFSLVVFLN